MKEQKGTIELELETYLDLYQLQKDIDDGRHYRRVMSIEYYDHDLHRFVHQQKTIAYKKDEFVEKLYKDLDNKKEEINLLDSELSTLKSKVKELPAPFDPNSIQWDRLNVWQFLKAKRKLRKNA